MHYFSLYIYAYSKSGCRRYSSICGGAPGDAHRENFKMHLEAVVVEKSVSYHHHSVWQGEAGGGVRRYRDNGDGLSDREYIFG